MVKIIVLLVVLATGQTAKLEYRQTFDTNALCEAGKAAAEAELYEFLKSQHDLDREEVSAKLVCDGKDAEGDDATYNAMQRLLRSMIDQGGLEQVVKGARHEKAPGGI